MDAGQFVREARRKAGITQEVLAKRAGVSQSLVARIERGDVDASFSRMLQLVRAAGSDLAVHVVPLDEDAWAQFEQGAALEPDQQLGGMLNTLRFTEAGRAAMKEARG
jgi:transcriptional regulator with XRE-family HTH domain